MSFKSDLYAWLTAQSGLTALVGDRIYPRFAPTSAARPFIVWSRISSTSTHRMGADPSFPDRGMMRDVIQFDIYAEAEAGANEVKEALQDTLNGLEIEMGETKVRRVFLSNEIDGLETPSDGTNDGEYRETMDFTFWYLRATSIISGDALLDEDGFYLLQEDDGKILLEAS